jgi:hypothetical protein
MTWSGLASEGEKQEVRSDLSLWDTPLLPQPDALHQIEKPRVLPQRVVVRPHA